MSKLESVKARIRALRAMTIENGCTESEAMSAAALAAKILSEHGLTLEEVERIRAKQDVGADVEMTAFKPRMPEISYCLVSIAQHFDCEVWSNSPVSFSLMGLPQDVFAAQTLTEIVADFMFVEWVDYETHKRRDPPGWKQDPAKYDHIKQAFLGAMGVKISDRLRRAKHDLRTVSNGSALVVAKHEIVRRAMEAKGIHLQKGEPIKVVDDFHASVAGAFAGKRVDLSNPSKVSANS